MSGTIQLTGPLEPRDGWVADGCSIAAALEVVSTRTAFLLLREAFYGATRFDEFVARAGVSEPVAAARLRELVEQGLLARQDYRQAGQRTRSGYALTDKGIELFPVLVALFQWGDRWTKADGGQVVLRHAGCGEAVAAELRCAGGHRVDVEDVELALRRRSRRGR